MNNVTRREAISSFVLTSGAFAAGMLTGCYDPLKNEKMIYNAADAERCKAVLEYLKGKKKVHRSF